MKRHLTGTRDRHDGRRPHRATRLAAKAGARAARGGASRPAPIDVTVHEGTSMSVAISPDGRTLAIDLQGSIWTLPAAGGAMTRITDVFNDARQPTWSPDGQSIAFFAYRDGGYDLWAIAPDGSNQHKLTWGAFDDREPIWSHDGTRIAFSSDRGNPLGSDYNIWMLDTAHRRVAAADESAPRRLHAVAGRPTTRRSRSRRRATTDESVWAVNVRRRRPSARCRSASGARRRAVVGAGRRARLSRHRRRPDAASRSTASRSPAARTCSRSARRGPRTDRVLLRVGRQDPPPLDRRRPMQTSTSRRRCR